MFCLFRKRNVLSEMMLKIQISIKKRFVIGFRLKIAVGVRIDVSCLEILKKFIAAIEFFGGLKMSKY